MVEYLATDDSSSSTSSDSSGSSSSTGSSGGNAIIKSNNALHLGVVLRDGTIQPLCCWQVFRWLVTDKTSYLSVSPFLHIPKHAFLLDQNGSISFVVASCPLLSLHPLPFLFVKLTHETGPGLCDCFVSSQLNRHLTQAETHLLTLSSCGTKKTASRPCQQSEQCGSSSLMLFTTLSAR